MPVSDQMKVLCEEHGINSFMMYLCEQHQLNDSELYDVFTLCKDLGALAMVHAENGDIIAKNQEKLIAKGVTSKFKVFFNETLNHAFFSSSTDRRRRARLVTVGRSRG